MNSQDESILTKMNFEDKTYLLSIYENVLSSTPENFLKHFSTFNSILTASKLMHKLNQLDNNGSPNVNVTTGVKVVKAFCLMNIFKQKFFHNEDYETNFLIEINLLIHYIFKILTSNNEEASLKIDNIELEVLSHAVLSKYFKKDKSSYEGFRNMIDAIGNNNVTTNEAQIGTSGNLSYENFQKSFRILIKFYLFSDSFEKIFTLLSHNSKVMTAELVVCLNKLIRGLGENSNCFIIAKKFLELIDTKQIYLNEEEYYTVLIRALIV